MTTETDAPTQSEATAELWEDFVDIFFAPASLFRRRADGRFWPAVLVLTIALTALYWVFQIALAPALEADMVRALDARAVQGVEITPQQVERMRSLSGVLGTLSMLVMTPLGVVLAAAVLWILARAFGSVASFSVAMAIAAYAQFPRIPGMTAAILQGTLLDPRSVVQTSIGPARLTDPISTSPAILAILGRFDLFVLWSTVLLGVGLVHAAGLSRSRAAVAAIAVWLVGGLPALLQALVL